MKNLNVKVSNEVLQWIGALLIMAGHGLNSLGSGVHNDVWNVVSFGLGTVFFFVWSLRVRNRPQIAVNVVAITVCAAGLYRAVV